VLRFQRRLFFSSLAESVGILVFLKIKFLNVPMDLLRARQLVHLTGHFIFGQAISLEAGAGQILVGGSVGNETL